MMEKRTDGLIITTQADRVGEKIFKCPMCYHVITHQEIGRATGRKRYDELQVQATRRSLELDHSGREGRPLHSQECMLCDSMS